MPSSVTQDQAARFAAIFAGCVSAYGQMTVSDTGQKTVKTYSKPLPSDAYYKHLEGDGPFFGVIMIREDNTCFFGAIDVDDDGIDLHELEAKVVAHRLPLVVCRSKSGGAHLYCFLREPVEARFLVDALKKFRSVLGHEKNANGSPVEIFPKQVKLSPGQTGNWINIPYYDHECTNRYAVTGQRQVTLNEFFDLVVARSTSERGLLEWADPALGPFKDGPPCLQQLHKSDFPEGTRNTGLLNVGLFYKASQPGTWKDALEQYNAGMEAPLDHSELSQIVRNLERHDYVYTCKIHPLEALCKKKECKKQEFGIGFFAKQKRLAALPELSNLVKIKTDPPRYKLSVNGNVIACSLDQVISPALFCKLLFAELNLMLQPPKPHEWNDLVRDLTDSMAEEDAPPEAGDRGLLQVYLQDFLQTRHKSDMVDDILLGRAALDQADGRVYFRGTDFGVFLQRRGFKRYNMNEMYTILRDDAGLTTQDRTLKGGKVSVWSVPEPRDEQDTPFDHPASRVVRVV
jgi:hypothetical protein